MAWYETLLHASTYSFSALFSWINFFLVVGGGFKYFYFSSFSGNVIENEFQLQFEHKTLKNSLVTCQTKGELKVNMCCSAIIFCFSTDGEVFASTDCVDMISRSVRVRHFGIVFGSPSSSCPSASNSTCVDVLVSGGFRIRPVWMTECRKLHDREIFFLFSFRLTKIKFSSTNFCFVADRKKFAPNQRRFSIINGDSFNIYFVK